MANYQKMYDSKLLAKKLSQDPPAPPGEDDEDLAPPAPAADPIDDAANATSDLADTINAVPDTEIPTPEPTGTPLAEKVSSKKVGQPSTEKIDSLTDKLANLQKTKIPGDTTDWGAKIAEAERMKSEGASRAAWANLAQIVGEGLVQVAAARDARAHGVMPVSIHGGPSVYEGMMKQVEQDYHDKIGTIKENYGISQNTRHELINAAERQYDDDRKAIEDQLNAEKYKLGQDVRVQERGEDRSERARMHSESLNAGEVRADARARAAEESAAHRDTESERKALLSQVNSDLARLQAKKQAANTIKEGFSRYDDMSGKDQKAFVRKSTDLAGKSGMDVDVEHLIDPDTGWFASSEEKKKARDATLSKNLLGPLQQEEARLLQERGRLSSPSPRGSAPAAPNTAPNASGPGMVLMRDPASGRQAKVPASNVDAAKARGLVVVGE